MDAKPCIFCGNPVEQTEGKKEKKFCNATCRQKKWQQDQRDLRVHVKQFGMGHFTPSLPQQISAGKTPDPVPQSTQEAYEVEIKATTYSGDLEKVIKAMEKDTQIGAVAKAKLRALANVHRLDFIN